MSFFDDLSEFGSGVLDSVEESTGTLLDGWVRNQYPDQTTNADTVQQPQAPRADNNGNAVTIPQGASSNQLFAGVSNQTLMIGGGVLVVGLLAIVAFK